VHEVRDTLGGAVSVAAGVPGPGGAALLAGARTAFTEGFNLVAAVGAVTVLLAAVVALVLLREVKLARAESAAGPTGHVALEPVA
jgi:DHA2 family multidrug resistance protein-like MFS transporter